MSPHVTRGPLDKTRIKSNSIAGSRAAKRCPHAHVSHPKGPFHRPNKEVLSARFAQTIDSSPSGCGSHILNHAPLVWSTTLVAYPTRCVDVRRVCFIAALVLEHNIPPGFCPSLYNALVNVCQPECGRHGAHRKPHHQTCFCGKHVLCYIYYAVLGVKYFFVQPIAPSSFPPRCRTTPRNVRW